MASKDGYKKLGKLIEVGLNIAKIAQAKAEESLRDVVHISEVQRNQVRELLEDAARKSKDSSEYLLKSLRQEFENQFKSANLVSREELSKLSEKLNSLSRELAKVSVLRDEVNRLTEILNNLTRVILKPDLGSHDSTSGPDGSTGTNGDSHSGNTEAMPPSGVTPPKTAARRPRASAKSDGNSTASSATPKSRTRANARKASDSGPS